MQHDAILREYDQVIPLLQAFGDGARDRVAGWISSEPGLKLHSITARIKARGSLARKLARPDRTYRALWDVTDLLGLRVITYFDDAVDRVGRVIERRLPVDFVQSVDRRRTAEDHVFGYRSLHYVCLVEGDLPAAARFEIQVRTLLEHAWAEIEHDLGYKSPAAIPAAARRRLHRLAGLLELADQEFGAIRRELDAYAAGLPERISRESEAVPLDQLSLLELLDGPEARALDLDVARILEKDLGDEPFFPEYLLRMLASSGVGSVAGAREGLRRHRETILAMVRPYFTFSSSAWSLSPERMDHVLRGYSLFFLAHAAVLEAPALGVNKVERLTRLYRELDYPDDARAAHRVASLLVDAFREGAGD